GPFRMHGREELARRDPAGRCFRRPHTLRLRDRCALRRGRSARGQLVRAEPRGRRVRGGTARGPLAAGGGALRAPRGGLAPAAESVTGGAETPEQGEEAHSDEV